MYLLNKFIMFEGDFGKKYHNQTSGLYILANTPHIHK